MDNSNNNSIELQNAVAQALASNPNMGYEVRVVDDKHGRGIDLPSLLFNARQIFLHGGVGEASVYALQKQLIYLSTDDMLKKDNRDLRTVLRICSPGGSVIHGLGVDTDIEHLREISKEPFYCIAENMAASMGSFLLQSAGAGCRMAKPHATIMIHEAAYGAGQGTKTSQHAGELYTTAKLEAQLFYRYAECIQKSYELFNDKKPSADFMKHVYRKLFFYMKNADSFLSSYEAQQLYLVDFVLHSTELQNKVYKANEMYYGLRKLNDDNSTVTCDRNGAGFLMPFHFHNTEMTDKEKTQLRAEGRKLLREAREESLRISKERHDSRRFAYDAIKGYNDQVSSCKHKSKEQILDEILPVDSEDPFDIQHDYE